MEHEEARLVGGKYGPRDRHAAERPEDDLSLVVPVPRRSQVIEEPDLLRRFVDEDLNGRLVPEVIAALHGVESVEIEGVVRLSRIEHA